MLTHTSCNFRLCYVFTLGSSAHFSACVIYQEFRSGGHAMSANRLHSRPSWRRRRETDGNYGTTPGQKRLRAHPMIPLRLHPALEHADLSRRPHGGEPKLTANRRKRRNTDGIIGYCTYIRLSSAWATQHEEEILLQSYVSLRSVISTFPLCYY